MMSFRIETDLEVDVHTSHLDLGVSRNHLRCKKQNRKCVRTAIDLLPNPVNCGVIAGLEEHAKWWET